MLLSEETQKREQQILVQWPFYSVTDLAGKIFVKMHCKKWKEKKKKWKRIYISKKHIAYINRVLRERISRQIIASIMK